MARRWFRSFNPPAEDDAPPPGRPHPINTPRPPPSSPAPTSSFFACTARCDDGLCPVQRLAGVSGEAERIVTRYVERIVHMVAYGSALSRTNSEADSIDSMSPTKRIPYSQQQRLPPWNMKSIRWGMASYITFAHMLGLSGLFYLSSCSAATLWFAFLLWPITGFGITGGAHRLWSHRSYSASPLFRGVVMLCNSCANQGSIWHWARDHRTHHFHSETVAGIRDHPIAAAAPSRWRARACLVRVRAPALLSSSAR